MSSNTANENTRLLDGNSRSTAGGSNGVYFLSRSMSQAGESKSSPPSSTSWFSGWFPRQDHNQAIDESQQNIVNKPRTVPIKVEPKVFFANERTFLAWLHMAVTLASISVAILAFAEANEWSQIYGIMLMPVAIAFCCYSLYMFIKRAAMIRRKDPGPYEDRNGPIALAAMLGLAIVVNFAVKVYDYAT